MPVMFDSIIGWCTIFFLGCFSDFSVFTSAGLDSKNIFIADALFFCILICFLCSSCSLFPCPSNIFFTFLILLSIELVFERSYSGTLLSVKKEIWLSWEEAKLKELAIWLSAVAVGCVVSIFLSILMIVLGSCSFNESKTAGLLKCWRLFFISSIFLDFSWKIAIHFGGSMSKSSFSFL